MKWNILMVTLMMQSEGNGAISPKITKECVVYSVLENSFV